MAEQITDTRRVDEFRDALMQISLTPGTRNLGDPFVEHLIASIRSIVDSTMKATDGWHEEEKKDDDLMDKLVDHWIDYYTKAAWQSITKSLTSGYSHAWARLRDQAEATACYQFSRAMADYKRTGNAKLSFVEMSDIRVVTRPE